MNTPMEKSIQLCIFGTLYNAVSCKDFMGIMLHRFGHPEVHQSNPHTCGKQHGNPRKERIIGLALVPSQPDIAVFTEHQINKEQNENRYRPNIDIIEVLKYESLDCIEHIFH